MESVQNLSNKKGAYWPLTSSAPSAAFAKLRRANKWLQFGRDVPFIHLYMDFSLALISMARSRMLSPVS